jgi:hypothetical protein
MQLSTNSGLKQPPIETTIARAPTKITNLIAGSPVPRRDILSRRPSAAAEPVYTVNVTKA